MLVSTVQRMNQLYGYIYPLLLGLPFHRLPHPTHLDLNESQKVWQALLTIIRLVVHRPFFETIFCVTYVTPATAATKSLQSCPTLCNPIDGSPPGSPVPGILQARTLEWVAISFSNAWKWKVKVKSLGRVQLFMTPWTAAYQAPPSMGFSRQEYWSGVPSASPYVTPSR